MTNLITADSDWTPELMEKFYIEIERIATDYLKLETFPNQIEIISSEQMLEAYSSVGMPIMYNHWSFGKSFVSNAHQYNKGNMGLAYEIVINSSPCISYCMESNTMMMQALVMAHAAFGHNSFFKNNYLFKQWTTPDAIIDYLVFAKKYVTECEEKYGAAEVELVLDAAHALQNYGVDKYKRQARLSAHNEESRRHEREEYLQSQVNELWSAVVPSGRRQIGDPIENFPADPQENLLYFLEKHAPTLPTWKRELIRIVRKMSQYFYPQRQTQVSNEGWACVVGNTLIDTPNGLLYAIDIVNNKYSRLVDDGTTNRQISQWYSHPEKNRIKIITRGGYTLHGGADHRIQHNGEWVQLNQLNVGDSLHIARGRDEWPTQYIELPEVDYSTRMTLVETCNKLGVHPRTYYKWKNKNGVVGPDKTRICEEVDQYLVDNPEFNTSKYLTNKRKQITMPTQLTEDFAYWLGLMIGDGHLHASRYKGYQFTSGDIELRDTFNTLTVELFGIQSRVEPDRNHWKVCGASTTLIDYLVANLNGKIGRSAHCKMIPLQLLQSPKSVVCAFIRGHMDTDGCATKSGNVILVSKSKELIDVEQQLLLKMGIVSSVRLQQDGCYKLSITGTDIKLFNEYIGFGLKRKQDRVTAAIANKHRFIEKADIDVIEEIVHDVGPVYDFGVNDTHQYKASAFINHNCFTHYNIMQKLYEEGLVSDGFMFEFYESHTGVINQPDFDDKRRYSGFNPYALGFAMFQDIKRVSTNPTDEDRNWFNNADWVGRGDWIEQTKYAMMNYKDESFIRQFLTPKLMRDFHLFVVLDDDSDDMVEIEAIHNHEGYKRIREALADQYMLSNREPNIQVVKVDRDGDRTMTLQHTMYNRKPLAEKDTIDTLKYLQYLWGFDVVLNCVSPDDKVKAKYEITDGGVTYEIMI